MVFNSRGKVTVSALSSPRVPVGSVATIPSAPHPAAPGKERGTAGTVLLLNSCTGEARVLGPQASVVQAFDLVQQKGGWWGQAEPSPGHGIWNGCWGGEVPRGAAYVGAAASPAEARGWRVEGEKPGGRWEKGGKGSFGPW